MKKLLGLAAAVGMLCLAPVVASASVISFDDETIGYYDITGGSGLYAGATDDGSSVISISKWYSGLPEFLAVEKSRPRSPATPVPEPSLTSLVAAGLAMVGFGLFRRRRADVTRG